MKLFQFFLCLMIALTSIYCGNESRKAVTYESEAYPIFGEEKAPVTTDMTGALHFDGVWVKTKKGFRLIKINEYRESPNE